MNRRCLAVASFCLFSIAYGVTQQTSNQEEFGKQVQHLMEVEVGFMNMVPQGMSIEAKEISRTGKSGSLVVKYNIYVKGAPADAIFRGFNWPANAEKPSVALDGITAAKDGLLICAGRTDYDCGTRQKPDDPIDFIVTPLKGEPFRVAFVAGDLQIGTVVVPDPVQAADKGCSLSAVRLTSKFELAFLSGSGYSPNTDIHYRVSTGDSKKDFVVKSTDQGIIRTGVVPAGAGKTKGTTNVKIIEPTCSPEVSYQWGTL